MTADIIEFPFAERMRSVWLARASGQFVNKYDIDPHTELYFQLMETIEVVLDEDGAEEWTQEEVDQLIASFFDDGFTIVIVPDTTNDN